MELQDSYPVDFNLDLLLLPLLDLTKEDHNMGNILIKKTTHPFSTTSVPSGLDPNQPCFGCEIFSSSVTGDCASKKKQSEIALAVIRVREGTQCYLNMTMDISLFDFYTNMHFHGLDSDPFVDGANTETDFGYPTVIGPTNRLIIQNTNNSAECWYHSHMMFDASPFIYGGMSGMYSITSAKTKKLDDVFVYGDNQVSLVLNDYQQNPDGTINNTNLYQDGWRGPYIACNFTTCVNISDQPFPHQNQLFHHSSRKNVKITLLNGSTAWSRYYIGVCDKNLVQSNFYFIETDQSYRNPVLVNLVSVSPGGRISIYVDLSTLEGGEAYVFLYPFDLTVNNSLVFYKNQLYNTDPVTGNPTVPFPFGLSPIPPGNNIYRFLKISYRPSLLLTPEPSSHEITSMIKNIVFGCNASKKITLDNYIQYLNPKYFYNLPIINAPIPTRRFIFFTDDGTSQMNGATEFVSSNRIMTDAWTDVEYQKGTLPSCLFKINKPNFYQASLPYYMCLINYKLTVTILDLQNQLVETGVIEFESIEQPINIVQWTDLVNKSFKNLSLSSTPGYNNLGELLTYGWQPTKYNINYVQDPVTLQFYKPTTDVNTVLISTTNSSDNYRVQLKSTWGLMNFFGKPFAAMVPDMTMSGMSQMSVTPDVTTSMPGMTHNMMDMTGTPDVTPNMPGMTHNMMDMTPSIKVTPDVTPSMPGMTHNMDPTSMGNLQQLVIYGGSVDGTMQPPDENNEYQFIIPPAQAYNGFADGFMNDNFFNVSLKENSNEKWIYNNMDNTDSHPFHMHLTSGFVDYTEPENLWLKNIANTALYNYSMDILAIPPQQSIAMRLKFVNHNSKEGQITNMGFMYHCHYLAHHDMGMMGQFYVFPKN
jgi:FtsP/CotA-like multicopper oxidase with cupredoxin domain